MIRLTHGRRGVSLIELLIVMAVLGIIMTPLLMSLSRAVQMAEPATRSADTLTRYSAADGFLARNLSLADRPLLQAYNDQLEFSATVNGETRSYMIWRECSPDPVLMIAESDPIRINRIPNPSFENGVDGWTYETTGTTPATPLSQVAVSPSDPVEAGEYSLMVTRQASTDSTTWADSDLLPVISGQRYLIAGSYRTTTAEDSPGSSTGTNIQYFWIGSDGLPLTDPGGSTEIVHSNSGWVRRAVRTQPAPDDAIGLIVRLSAGEMAQGDSYFDGITMTTDIFRSSYFDGDSSDSGWIGVPHESKSIQGRIGFIGTWPGPSDAPDQGVGGRTFARLASTGCDNPAFTYLDESGISLSGQLNRSVNTHRINVFMPPETEDQEFGGPEIRSYTLGSSRPIHPWAPVHNGSFEDPIAGSWTLSAEALIVSSESDHGDQALLIRDAPSGSGGQAHNAVRWDSPIAEWEGATITVWARQWGSPTALPQCSVSVQRDVGDIGVWTTLSTVDITPSWDWRSYRVDIPDQPSGSDPMRLLLSLDSVGGSGPTEGGCLFDRISSMQGGMK